MNKGKYIVSRCLRTEDWYYVTELTKKEKRVVEAKRKEFKKQMTVLSFDEYILTDKK